MDNYNTCSFVIIHSMTNAVIPRTLFFMELNPAPFLLCRKELMKKRISLENAFVKQLYTCCTKAFSHENTAKYFMALYCWLNASLGPYFGLLFRSWLQAALVKLHLRVSQFHSVYFCIWRKGDGLKGGRFGAKQTQRVSALKVNITLCLNYTPSALQFSHTLALSTLSPIPANTPSSQPS